MLKEKVTQIDGTIGRCQSCFFPHLSDLYSSEDGYAILYYSEEQQELVSFANQRQETTVQEYILCMRMICICYAWCGYICLGMLACKWAHAEAHD